MSKRKFIPPPQPRPGQIHASELKRGEFPKDATEADALFDAMARGGAK